MSDIIEEFKSEVLDLVAEMEDILEKVEQDPSDLQELEHLGLIMDRIMGGARSIELNDDSSKDELRTIGHYADICKKLGYKAAQVNNEALVKVVVAFLFDAVEGLEKMVKGLGREKIELSKIFQKTYLERLHWIAKKFDEDLPGTVALDPSKKVVEQAQKEINSILKQMGFESSEGS